MENSGSNNVGLILIILLVLILFNPREERHIEAITFEEEIDIVEFIYANGDNVFDWEYFDCYIFSIGKLDGKVVTKGYLGKVVRVY